MANGTRKASGNAEQRIVSAKRAKLTTSAEKSSDTSAASGPTVSEASATNISSNQQSDQQVPSKDVDDRDITRDQPKAQLLVAAESAVRESHPQWMEKLDLLKRYISENGHCRVPTKLDSKLYPKLGPWVSVQRTAFRWERQRKESDGKTGGKNRISAQQIELLENVNFLWSATATARNIQAWEKKFALLQKYKERHGHTQVPKAVNSEEFPQLGHWVQRQRSAYKNEQMLRQGQKLPKKNRRRISEDKIGKLEALGFEWTVRRYAADQEQNQTKSVGPHTAATSRLN